MSDTFDKNIRKILFPVLKELGFQQVKLKGIMCPEYLFNNGDVWFSLSWDWRDQYLDVSLGKLFWFKDVMERVVVIGDYSNYEERITYSAMSSLGSDVAIFEAIAESLKGALKTYTVKYKEIFQDFRVSRSKRGGINIDKYIGAEVGLADLQKFKA
tara:strand:+ start:1086 stop:1553 length:468 start_codon:yes stop_codon:yes gene_type:complete